MFIRTLRGRGGSPRVLDSLRGCQYRMTSYDEDTNWSAFNPAYSIHLHDPRLLEYVGAPESAHYMAAMGLWHPVCRGFMAPCRRRLATRACPVQTAFLIFRSSGF